ncbi:MAG: response regulator [Bacteroidota bacterium]
MQRLSQFEILIEAAYTELPDSALFYAEQQYLLAQQLDQPDWMAHALIHLGNLKRNLGQYSPAKADFQSALQLYELYGEVAGMAHAWYELGYLADLQGDRQNASQYYQRVLDEPQAVEDPVVLATTWLNMANLHQEANRYDLAIQHLRAGILLAEAAQLPGIQAEACNRMGLVFADQGKYDLAEEQLHEAIRLTEPLDKPRLQALNLLDLGNIFRLWGKFEAGLQAVQEGLGLVKDLGPAPIQGNLRLTVAQIYVDVENREQARRYFQAGLEQHQLAGYFLGVHEALMGLGQIHLDEGDIPKAEEYFHKALTLAEEIVIARPIASSLLALGEVQLTLEQEAEAQRYFERSLNIYQEVDDPTGKAHALARLGSTLLAKGELALGQQRLEQSLQLYQELGIVKGLAEVSAELYPLYQDQPTKALASYQLYIQMRDSLDNLENQKALLRFEYANKSLADSLAFVQKQTATELSYQHRLNQRNYLVLIGLMMIALLFVWFRNQQRRRTREKAIELERERERKQSLAELHELKSRFFANISHELRTPLTLILGPLSYLLDNPDAWKQSNIREQLLLMQRNGKSLLHLIEEILDLSKIEANKLQLEARKTPLAEFAQSIFARFQPQLVAQQIEAELQLEIPEEAQYMLDAPKLAKVLNNLLSNALKFTPTGGKVTFLIEEAGQQLHFRVRDSGVGIHPKDLPHIFDRFYQSQHKEETQPKGTGIGLGLARELVLLMDGQIYAKSELGQGAEFSVELPVIRANAPQGYPLVTATSSLHAEIGVPAAIGSDFGILIVEDHWDMREFVRQLLQPHYRQVFVARDGEEGLKVLEEQGTKIDLIISDVMMPKLDGLSMVEQIKASPKWSHLPVIMLTALANERNKLQALTLGVDDYLTKPFSTQELLTRVQNLLQNARQRKKYRESPEFQQEASAETTPESVVISANDRVWLQEVQSLIESGLPKTKWSVDQLAKQVNLSPRQLRRRLKSITGLSPLKFIREIQLQVARRELEDGTVTSLADLAYRCGFEQQGTFSTSFKKRFGKSPREYGRSQVA